MTLRVEEAERRGYVRMSVPAGQEPDGPVTVQISRDVDAGYGRHFDGKAWGTGRADLTPQEMRFRDGELQLVFGPDVAGNIDAQTPVDIDIPALGVSEHVFWPELAILPSSGDGLSGRVQGEKPLDPRDVSIAPETLTFKRQPDNVIDRRPVVFRLATAAGAGIVGIGSDCRELDIKPGRLNLRRDAPGEVAVAWRGDEAITPASVTIVFDVSGIAIERVVRFEAPIVDVPPPPPSPPPPLYELTPAGVTEVGFDANGKTAPAAVTFKLRALTQAIDATAVASSPALTLAGEPARHVAAGAETSFVFMTPPQVPAAAVDIVFTVGTAQETRQVRFVRPARRFWLWVSVSIAVGLAVLAGVLFWLWRPADSRPGAAGSHGTAREASIEDVLNGAASCDRRDWLLQKGLEERSRPGGSAELGFAAIDAAAQCGDAEAAFQVGLLFDPSGAPATDRRAARSGAAALDYYSRAARGGHPSAGQALSGLCTWLRRQPEAADGALAHAMSRHCPK